MDEHSTPSTSTEDFFLRSGLTSQDQFDCYKFVENLYPGSSIAPVTCQGYCSLTLFVDNDIIIQFRPFVYRLDLEITQAAREVYGRFAPETRYIATLPTSGLLVYIMSRIEGISFKDFRASNTPIAKSTDCRARLCKDFATFLSKSWCTVPSDGSSAPLRKIGKSIVSRLKSLCTDLPIRFQATARTVLKRLHHIDVLPWVLTHGDIVASNLMIDPSTGRLSGLVDYAEAEYLPFGVCLYGLEEILGEMTSRGFEYRPDASDLREIFWTELKERISDLQNKAVLEAVKLARDLGVLLWFGIAFDDGAINRIVEEDRDVEEILRLNAFLDIHESQDFERGSKI